MKKQIEIEVRGKLNNFEETLNKFKNKAKFIEEKDRLSLVYFRGDSPITSDSFRKEKSDFKIRVTNKKAEIVMKYGIIKGSESRKEILIPISLDKFDEAVELFKILDWHKGIIMTTKTYVFEYNGVEFAIVNGNKNYDYFEAEILAEENEDHEKKMEEINKVCQELQLAPFSEQEFFDFLDEINKDKEYWFDFNNQEFNSVKERFKEFF